jgi:4-amino-4-deoxychorismate lyase
MTAALFNGKPEAGAWIRARGLHYGDGVFRTALVFDGNVVDLDRQLAKLASDARQLHLSAGVAACRRDATKLARGQRRAVIKWLLWRGAKARGYRPASATTERLVMIDALPARTPASWTRGVAAFRSPVVISEQPLLAGIKHLNRAEQVLASIDWPRGAMEAILCDRAGRPIGGTRSNLFWIRRGRLYTPQLSACGVAGVMREKVLEVAQSLGIDWRIDTLSWREFATSDEAFLTNSLIGIWPLRSCDRHEWRAPGAFTREIMRHLSHPLVPA